MPNFKNNSYSKRILIVSHNGRLKGGAQFSLLSFLKSISKKEFDITVSIPIYEGLDQELSEIGIKCIRLYNYRWDENYNFRILKFARSFFACFLDLVKMYIFVRKNNIQLIITNTIFPLSGAIVAKVMGIKHVWHVRESILDDNYNFFLKNELVSKIVGKLSFKIFVPSKFIKCNSIQSSDVDKTVIIPNNLDIRDFKNFDYQNLKGIVRVGMIGSISPIKGQIKIVELAKLFKGEKIMFYIIGNVSSNTSSYEYFKNLKKYITKESMAEQLIIKNFMPREDAYKNLDVIINFCEVEAFGRTIIESMAAKKIIISVNRGAAAELINDNRDGFLFEPNESEKIFDIINKLRTSKTLYYKIAREGYLSVEKKYTSLPVKKYMNSIKQILG